MKLSHKYQPQRLSEIVGQPAITRRLHTFTLEPYPCCVLLEGPGGVGKSATAQALINELAISPFSVAEYSGAAFNIETVNRLFEHTFRLRPMLGDWHVLLVEELEFLTSRQVCSALKCHLSEQNHPARLIFIATSNDTSGLDRALLQRFDIFPFSAGPVFAEACAVRLAEIWETETGLPYSGGFETLGWDGKNYSMRRALSAMEGALLNRRAVA